MDESAGKFTNNMIQSFWILISVQGIPYTENWLPESLSRPKGVDEGVVAGKVSPKMRIEPVTPDPRPSGLATSSLDNMIAK